MKRWIVAVLPFIALAAHAQEGMMDMTPPKELAQIDWMLGTWKANLTMPAMEPGGKPATMKTTLTIAKSLGGRYHSGKVFMDDGEMKMEGLHLLTFDAAKKEWKAWWFDSAAAGAMEMTGTLNGDVLEMVSKPTPMPGMGDVTMRATWSKAGARELAFKLEMKQPDGKWGAILSGTYKKA
jgi:hypothetical protein